jgi:hypothetical protein
MNLSEEKWAKWFWRSAPFQEALHLRLLGNSGLFYWRVLAREKVIARTGQRGSDSVLLTDLGDERRLALHVMEREYARS